MIFTASDRKQLEKAAFTRKRQALLSVSTKANTLLTDSVGIVNATADYVVRPFSFLQCGKHFLSFFLSSVSLTHSDDQMQNPTGTMGF